MKINVYTPFFNEVRKIVKQVARYVMKGEGITEDLNLILINRDELRKMKSKFLGEDLFTDVIAFNLDNINEIYVAPEIVFENAFENNLNFEEELVRVVVHGILHLRGLTDEELWEDQEKYVKEILKLFNR